VEYLPLEQRPTPDSFVVMFDTNGLTTGVASARLLSSAENIHAY